MWTLAMQEIQLWENQVETGVFRIPENRLTRAIRISPTVISITPCFDAERENVARFITSVYRESFKAHIEVDYPCLISVRDGSGSLVAAAGFRFAGEGPLFLERYTGAAIDEILATSRNRIAEIGNLVSSGGGVSIFLFAALASYLHGRGIHRAVATSTRSLEKRFRALGLEPRRICNATAARVAADGVNWGTYYDTAPCVVAGSVDLAMNRLHDAFGANYYTRRPRLFPRLHFDASRA
jgi:hypothetical protein